MSAAPPSLWRVVAYTVLFWLLRKAGPPFARYAILLAITVMFVLISPLLLVGYGYGEESRRRYEPAE